MEGCSSIDKRSLICATRMRFAPESQEIRETAVDKIVERQLFVLDQEGGISIKEIEQQEDICLKDGTPVISSVDIEKSLKRLKHIGTVTVTDKEGERFRLSAESRRDHSDTQQVTEKIFSRVLNRLFKNATEGAELYRSAFIECLCTVFSELGEIYVSLIKGEVKVIELLRSPVIENAIKTIKDRYDGIDTQLFESRVISFFSESDPDYVSIKWNMAQNYYIAKAIGLDPSGYLLSRELFGGAKFYLDTNLIIHALEPKARRHGSFRALSVACGNLCQ